MIRPLLFDPSLPANLSLVSTEIRIGGRLWNVTAVRNQDELLTASEEFEHFPFGLLLWESAIGLGEYLYANPGIVSGKTVLELGAGVGLSGVIARSLGGIVTQTDHQKSALQLSQFNADTNGIAGIRTFIGDWRSWNHPEKYDIVIGADITYEREMHFYLERTFQSSLAPKGTLILSDPGRPQTLEFVARLERTGWRAELETISVPKIEEKSSCDAVDVSVFSIRR